uniref:Genome polyprotein n=1 Tax=Picornavirales sp. TaxID=1955153 RepID=A0A6M9Z7A5_9VIRU|nr:MAG: hypothetical protein [Picornavirales sp.]
MFDTLEMQPVIEFEMEEPSAHGSEQVVQNQASNVILTSTQEESLATTMQPQQQTWTEFCSSEIRTDYNNLVNRWIQIDTFEWSKDSPRSISSDTILRRYILPKQLVLKVNDDLCNIPNSFPFRIHRYWRGDLEIKIHINSNKFQTGSLQCAWLYNPTIDVNSQLRENVYTLSQTNHVIVNASSSNEATLCVPFKYHLPLLATKPRGDMHNALNLGTLYISVLNQLQVAEGGSGFCSVTVFVKCTNNEFTGMLSGDIDPIKPEMDRIANTLVEEGLNMIFPDRNRDNPPRVGAPSYLVPTASHSWSAGTGVSEPLHSLRLDLRGQTPHPPGIEITNEMLVSHITRVFGLVRTFTWSKDDEEGKLLFDCNAAPILEKSQYFMIQKAEPNKLASYCIPPIGVASSMFMGWRGTIEFRFDVVASQYHTGRLMIGFVPGATNDTKITLNKLRCSANTVVSIQDTSQFTYSIPYICNRPLWPRQYGGDFESQDTTAPARMYVFVVNKLIPMQSVPNHVRVNIYMRAGEDFELIVPVQPAFGLAWDRNYISHNIRPGEIHPVAGYTQYYSGAFTDIWYQQCFRYGQYSRQVAHFDGENYYNTQTDEVSYCMIKQVDNKFIYYDKNGKPQVIQYAVFKFIGDEGFIIGIPCVNQTDAINLAVNLFKHNLPLNNDANKDLGVSNAFSTSSNTWCINGTSWIVKTAKAPASIHGEIGEESTTLNLLQPGITSQTLNGMKLFGENFKDFKDLCRRYQFYGFVSTKSSNVDSDKVIFKFPCLPGGLALNKGTQTNVNELHNRLRDGHIPLVASGFRFYRGGLRYRIVMCSTSSRPINLVIQHRPDRSLRSYSLMLSTRTIDGDVTQNHTYSSYIQISNVNNVVEFEVPFYLMGMYGLLQQGKIPVTKADRSEELDYFSLGDIDVSIMNIDRSATTMFSIFYSIADDMSFSTYQGFPPVVFCSDVPADSRSKLQDLDIDDCVYPEMGLSEIVSGMIGIRDAANTTGESIVTAASVASETISSRLDNIARTSIEDIKVNVSQALDSAITTITHKLGDDSLNNSDLILHIGLELLHLINHRDLSTLALVVIKVLINIKVIVVNNFMECVQSVLNMLLTWLRSRSSNELQPDAVSGSPVVSPESDAGTILFEQWEGVIGMLYGGICTAMGACLGKPYSWEGLRSFFLNTVPKITRGCVFIIGFFKVIGGLVSHLSNYIMRKIYPLEGWYHSLNTELPSISKWMDECLHLDSIDLSVRVFRHNHLRERIYAAYVYGQRIMVHYGQEKPAQMISRVFDIIRKKYHDMIEMGEHPFVRKEPFFIWMFGKTRIGKSYLTEHLSAALLDAINYDLKGMARTFTIMPTNDYWSGCKNQPVLVMDDAFSVEVGQTLERTLNHMYMIKSSCVLNPPQAALEEKNHRYNPEIFYVNSNKDFINLAGVDATAIHSRRDVLIKVEVVDPNKPTAADYSAAERRNFGHLRFSFHKCPSWLNAGYDEPLNYSSFVKKLSKMYQKFYIEEQEKFDERMSTYLGTVDINDEEQLHMKSLDDELNELKIRQAELYQQDLKNCIYTKVKEGVCYVQNKIAAVPEKITNLMFNRFMSVPLAAEMDEDDPIELFEQECEIATFWQLVHELKQIEEEAPHAEWSLCTKRRHDIISELQGIDYGWPGKIIMDIPQIPTIVASHDASDIAHLVSNENKPLTLAEYFEKLYDSWVAIDKLDFSDEEKFQRLELAAGHNLKAHDLISKCIQLYYGNKRLTMMPGLPQDSKDFSPNLNRSLSIKMILITQEFKYWKVRRNVQLFYKIIATMLCPHLNCVHLNPDNKWDMEHRKWYLDYVTVKDSKCGRDCMIQYPIIWHLIHVNMLNKLLDGGHFIPTNLDVTRLPQYLSKSTVCDIKTDIITWKNSFSNFCKSILYEKLPAVFWRALEVMRKIGIIVSCMFFTWMGIQGVKAGISWWTSKDMTVEGTTKTDTCPLIAEGQHAYDIKMQPHVRSAPVPHVLANPQASSENFNNLVRIINRNAFIIKASYVNDSNVIVSLRARGLIVNGYTALFIKHYHEKFLKLPSNTIFTYITDRLEDTKGTPLEIPYKQLEVKNFTFADPKFSSNFCLLRLPPQVPMGRNIRNLFMTVKGHHNVGLSGNLIEFGVGIRQNLPMKFCGPFFVEGDKDMNSVYTMNAYSYGVHGKGMCGSVLCANMNTECPIIGMHVAGGGSTGYAEPVYREMFDCFDCGPDSGEPLPTLYVPIVETEAPKIEIETTVINEGVIEKQHAHVETGKTQYIPSLIQGVFPVETEPNPLSIRDKRIKGKDPMKTGCEFMGMPVKPFDQKIVKLAVDNYEQLILSNVKPLKRVGKLSLEQAICGIQEFPHYEPLAWNTSPGFGFTATRPKNATGKRYLFDLEETNNGYKLKGIHQDLKKILKDKDEARLQNKIQDTVFVDCLKDTCISKEKCLIPGKTRIFSISPVDYTIHFRQYCGDFMAAMTHARFNAEHAIGMAVNSPEWSELANSLVGFNGKIITGDYSNFGPGLSLEIAYQCFMIIEKWYRVNGADAKHIRVLHILFTEMLNAKHLAYNVLYSVCCGVPSGSPITAILNSMVNSVYIRCAYFSLVNVNQYVFKNFILQRKQKQYNFLDMVKLITYGDDLIMAVKSDVIELFNFNTISKYFNSMNIRFTSAEKKDDDRPYLDNIFEATFLSCAFKLHPKRPLQWLSALKTKSVEGCVNWVKRKGCIRENTLENAQQSVMLAFGHGETYFNMVRDKIRVALAEHNMPFVTPSWDEYDKVFYDDECAHERMNVFVTDIF